MSRFFDNEGREMGYRPNFYMCSYLPWDLVIDDPLAYAVDLTSQLSPGLIVVFHDNDQSTHHNGQTRTVAALDSFLKRLAEKGYKAESLENVEKIAASNRSSKSRVSDAVR
jgi:peptidoglycan/xylan/chitin deacetylase (PgdA/CDA1 family)